MVKDEDLVTKNDQQAVEIMVGDKSAAEKENRMAETEIQKKGENELTNFREAVKKKTQEFASSLELVQDFLSKFSAQETKEALAIPDESAAQLKEIYEGLNRKADGLAAISENYEDEIKVRLEKLEILDMETDQSAVLDSLIKETADMLCVLKRNAMLIPQLEKQAQETHEAYKTALVKECGYESIESLVNGYWDKQRKITSLRRQIFGLGRWKNKEMIKELEVEAEKLEEAKKLNYHFGHSYNRHSLSQYRIEDMAKELVDQVANKCVNYYEQLLRENPEPERNQENLLSDTELSDLNDQYIKAYVLPYIEIEKDSYRDLVKRGYSQYRGHLSNLENPKMVAQLLELIKRSHSEAPGGYSYDKEEVAKREEFGKQLSALPEGLHHNFNQFINLSAEPTNKKFEELAAFVAAKTFDDKPGVIKNNYCSILHLIKSMGEVAQERSNLYLGEAVYKSESRLRQIEDYKDALDINKFLLNFDIDRWEVLKASPQMIARFGQKQLEATDRYIGQEIKKQILQSPSHSDSCINLGYKLYHFKEAEYVPLAILNAFREPGYSGEMPFISVHTSKSDETILYKYLTSINPSEVEKIKATNIPGCNQIIDLILDNPSNFSHSLIYNHETEKNEENLVYQQIQQNIGRMAIHFLQQGERRMDFYLMDLLDYLQADLGEGHELLAKVLCYTKDEKTKAAVLDCVIKRINQGDVNMASAIADVYDNLTDVVKNELKKNAGKMMYGLSKKENVDDKTIAVLGSLFNRSSQDMNALLDFIKFQRQSYSSNVHDITDENIDKFFDAATNPEIANFCKRFQAAGYVFSAEHMGILPELVANQDILAQDIEEIKKVFPEFRYIMDYDYKYNPDTKQSEKIFYPDAFDCLMKQKGANDLFPAMAQLLEKEGDFRQEFSNGLLRSLRRSDNLLQKSEGYQSEPEQKTYALFYEGLQNLIRESFTSVGKLREFSDIFQNQNVLRFIARQPEKIDEIIKLPETVPDLFSLFQPGKPLFTNRDNVLREIFENGDALRRAKEVASVFTKKVPYWKQLFLFTESRIGEKLASATSDYPITEISGVSLKNIVQRHIRSKNENPEVRTTLEGMISNPVVLEQLASGNISSVPLNQFTGMYKKLIFRDYLRRTIETSRSDQAKAVADLRNRPLAVNPFVVVPDTYIHGSRIEFIDSMMLNGNLPQEALGEKADTDSYPFQVDFSKLTADYLKQQNSVADIFNNSISGTYGSGGHLGLNGQIYYVYDRSKAGWESGKDCTTSPGGSHALMLGGIPSTEVTGIVLRNTETSLSKVKQAVLEQGFYIPVYDLEGKLLMTPEEYDQTRDDYNLKVPVEVWDYSLETGGRLGSNEGGEFTVPEKEGSSKYYVKFGRDASSVQLWNEQLADNFYRVAGLGVPDTKVVKIEASFGHASRIIEGYEPSPNEYRTLIGPGFIMDCWLANWDVAAKSDNVKINSESGRLNRIDNGGALLFRARGERKPSFGDIVTELETMRSGYPGLTLDEIKKQTEMLQEIFTDEVIDQQVDNIRLSQHDREYLKITLRNRRDYIVSYFEKGTADDIKQLTNEGREIPMLLRMAKIDEERLAAIVPEWKKINSETGYQHNGVLLSEHLKEALTILHNLPEFKNLDSEEQNLAAVAILFHDIAKPTGTRYEEVARDFSHETPSAQLAANYMQKWGFSRSDIRVVVQAILFDGVVSDIARGKVRDQSKNLTPEQLKTQLNDFRTIRILRALNHADVVATVGEGGYRAIEKAYNAYFDKIKEFLS